MKSRDLDRLFSGLEPAAPPAQTRTRAVAAALAADVEQEDAGEVWARLWQSRPARLAWAAAVTVLVIANLALSVSGPNNRGGPPGHTIIADSGAQPSELAAIAELPRIRLEVLPHLGSSERSSSSQKSSSNPTPRRQS